ncbi:MAG TPA: AAA family ATPase [Rubricoccaceae bacterium]
MSPENAPVRFCTCPDGIAARERFERSLSLGYREAVVPSRLAGCSMETARRLHADGAADKPATPEGRAALDAAERFVGAYRDGRAPGAGLVLTGPVGTGKSALLAAVTHAVRALGVPVLWYTYAGLYAAVQEHYGKDHRDARQSSAERAPVLVLDDLGDPYRVRGEDQETEDRRRIVHAVVSARAAHFRPTLVSANYGSLNDLADQFDPRIADRLRESCERHTMPGQSLRRAPRI